MNLCKKALALLVSLSILFLSSLPLVSPEVLASGTEYYVSPTGDDSNPGTIDKPFKTINTSAKKLKPGETLYVRGGTYTDDSVQVSTSGTAEAPITIKAYEGETPIIVGKPKWGTAISFSAKKYIIVDGINTLDTYNGSALNLDSGEYITIRNCTFKNNRNVSETADFAYIKAGGYYTIENCTFNTTGGQMSWGSGQGEGIYVNGAHNTLIQNNHFIRCGHYAADLKESSRNFSYNNVIRNNLVESHWGGGFGAIFGAHHNTIENNRIYYVGEECYYPKTGIQIASDKNIIRNNILAMGGSGGTGVLEGASANAVDGDDITYWKSYNVSNNGMTQWYIVDLEEAQSINKAVITWGGNWAKEYKLQVSSDGDQWEDIYSSTNGKEGITKIKFADTDARYARLYLTNASITNTGYSINEFQIFGKESSTTNLALNKKVLASSTAGPSASGICLYSYALNNTAQNCIDNRVYNNVAYKNGLAPIQFSERHNTITDKNKVLNNIFFYNRLSGSPNTGTDGNYYYATFETAKSDTSRDWQAEFPRDNQIYNNLWMHSDILGDHTGTKFFEWDGGKDNPSPWTGTLEEAETKYPDKIFGNIEKNPVFVNADAGDFRLQSNSPAIDAGAHLTKTTAAGTDTTSIPVEDALFFNDGYDIVEGDTISISGKETVKITDVDYDTNILTVDRAVSFNKGDSIDRPYSGSAPDLGISEFSANSSPMPTLAPADRLVVIQEKQPELAGTDVAYNKTVTTDSENEALKASSIVNPEANSHWSADDFEVGHWVKIDLGESYDLNGARIKWYKPNTVYQYKIEVSSNDTDWKTASDKTANTSKSQTQVIPFSQRGVRYVKITVTGLETNTPAAIWDVKIFSGKTAVPETPVEIILAPGFAGTFSDLTKTNFAFIPVEMLVENGVIVKSIDATSGKFRPDSKITRAEFATFISRALTLNLTSYKGKFKDVKASKYYAKHIEAAERAGIITGLSKGKFSPDGFITNEGMAVMVMKAYTYSTGKKLTSLASGVKLKFKDAKKISSPALNSVKAAYHMKLISGTSFAPQSNITRAQTAKIIYSLTGQLG